MSNKSRRSFHEKVSSAITGSIADSLSIWRLFFKWYSRSGLYVGNGTSDDTDAADPVNPDKDNEANREDQPKEYDEKEIEWMGVKVHPWRYDFVDAEHFNSWQSLIQLMLEQYNLIEKVTIVDGESYSTTLNGLLAADDLPDCFQMRFDISTFCNAVANGKLADMDKVPEYSDDTAYNVYQDGLLVLPILI